MERYGRLTIIKEVERKNHRRRFLCQCDCGNNKIIQLRFLKMGNTKSCGCLIKDNGNKHGYWGTRTYKSWDSMKSRCLNPNNKDFNIYGGAGITVCDRWMKFENFLADMGERPEGTTLDRYPNQKGNYEPNNCRWATITEQNRNRKNVRNKLN